MATALGGVEGCSKDYAGPGRKVCVEVGRSLVGRSAVVPTEGCWRQFFSVLEVMQDTLVQVF